MPPLAPPAATPAEPEWFPGTVGTHFAGKPLAIVSAEQLADFPGFTAAQIYAGLTVPAVLDRAEG